MRPVRQPGDRADVHDGDQAQCRRRRRSDISTIAVAAPADDPQTAESCPEALSSRVSAYGGTAANKILQRRSEAGTSAIFEKIVITISG